MDITTTEKQISQYISDLCHDNGIPEMVCVFQTPENKTITLHIATDGEPSNSYRIIKLFIDDLIAEASGPGVTNKKLVPIKEKQPEREPCYCNWCGRVIPDDLRHCTVLDCPMNNCEIPE